MLSPSPAPDPVIGLPSSSSLVDIVKTKIETEEFEKQVKDVKKDVKKLSAGIMAKPETEETE